jgi:outer membrane protein assembly factor BamB
VVRWLAGAAVALGLLGLAAVLVTGPNRGRLAYERSLDDRVPEAVLRPDAEAPLPDAGAPPELGAGGWPVANGDLEQTRTARDAKITAANVGRLGVAWKLDLHGASKWGAAASGPLISNGVVYFQDLVSNVHALDAKTGAERWRRSFAHDAFGPNGPALGWGRVYVQDGQEALVGLDAKTGKVEWRAKLAGPTGQQQPVAWSRGVLTGIAAGRRERGEGEMLHTGLLRPAGSGFVYGVHADDGAIAWEMQTVEKGYWGNPAVNGGAGIWFPPAVDGATGLTFWSTGNPGPAPGTKDFPNASSRPGPNLYSNTLLALDGRTGKLVWFNQLLPHDMLHHDLQNAPILVEAGGRKLVVASGKMGVVYALDRRSGKLVWKRAVGRHENDTLKEFPAGKATVVYPGFWGGIETPGAFADGTLYFQVDDLPTPYEATAWEAKDGRESVEHLEGRTEYAKGTSSLVALDAASGKVRWTHRFPTVGFGAATVVNDLVFTSTYDGVVYALRRSNGSVAWRWQAPGGINAWPAVSGDTLVLPVGLGLHPALVALRLGAGGDLPIERARPPKAKKP